MSVDSASPIAPTASDHGGELIEKEWAAWFAERHMQECGEADENPGAYAGRLIEILEHIDVTMQELRAIWNVLQRDEVRLKHRYVGVRLREFRSRILSFLDFFSDIQQELPLLVHMERISMEERLRHMHRLFIILDRMMAARELGCSPMPGKKAS